MDEKNILREGKLRPIRKEAFSLWKIIHSIDADEFDRRISNWLISQKCFKGKGLAVDGTGR